MRIRSVRKPKKIIYLYKSAFARFVQEAVEQFFM